MSVNILARQPVNSNLRFVAPVSDFTLGRRMFQAGARITACTTDEQAQGWLAAEEAGYNAYLGEMNKHGLPIEFDTRRGN